ncbi:MAG TPA: family 16 glycosylhydrolase [Solirubrobacteraceae bacterium]
MAQAEPMPDGIPGTWALRVNEEFTGAGLNTALWTPGWQSDASISGPMSEECVASKNVSQSGNGYLYLQLRKEKATCGGKNVEDTGGLIESNPADGVSGHSGFAYTYGVVEWEAYVPGVAPAGRGCPTKGCLPDWPALWSHSNTNADEIDEMEGLETLGQACFHIHPPTDGPGACLSGSYAGAWHKYASEWELGAVKFFYDGAQVGELSSGELNGTPQYLIADMVYPGCCNQPAQVPDEMTVNYVRVWQHPPPPPPPLPPEATTSAASGVTEEQATLNGSVNPKGTATSYYFQYGKTTSYGSRTEPEGNAGSGQGSVGESATVAGLDPGTTYHYRLVAASAGGTSYESDQTFTTVSRPSAFIQTNGYQAVFYPGRSSGINELLYTTSWLTFTLGGEPTGNPVAVYRESTNEQWVYYRGQNGAIQELFYYKGSWDHFELGGSAAGSRLRLSTVVVISTCSSGAPTATCGSTTGRSRKATGTCSILGALLSEPKWSEFTRFSARVTPQGEALSSWCRC